MEALARAELTRLHSKISGMQQDVTRLLGENAELRSENEQLSYWKPFDVLVGGGKRKLLSMPGEARAESVTVQAVLGAPAVAEDQDVAKEGRTATSAARDVEGPTLQERLAELGVAL